VEKRKKERKKERQQDGKKEPKKARRKGLILQYPYYPRNRDYS
jgi:hypothetical protein